MPNGTDCSSLLQTEALSVPTQWFILDCTAQGEVKSWITEDQAPSVDCCLLPRPAGGVAADSVEALKRAIIEARPAVLAQLADSYERRCRDGTEGRLVIWVIAELSDALGALALAELPIDLSNRIFFGAGLAPAVLRCAIGGSDEEKRRTLALLKPQYFDLPDYSRPYYDQWEPRQLYANEFDSTLLLPDRGALRRLLSHLLPLHVEETARTRARLQRHREGGVLIIESAMARSLSMRRIDWLALAMYPHFPRLWDDTQDDILDVLDFRRCPERARDPWAALKQHKRERSWDHLTLPEPTHDLLFLEEPYRISPGDHRTRLPLAQRLARQGDEEEALAQLARARAESPELPIGWLKLEGLIRHRQRQEDAARGLLSQYVERLSGANPEPADSVLDDLGSVQLLLRDYPRAAELARRAIERNKELLHAYDTLVLASRESGDPKYEAEAVALARANQVTVPLLAREQAHKPPQLVDATAPSGSGRASSSGAGWVVVRSCRDNAEAALLKSVLTDAGIRCVVQGENHRSMLGFLGAYIELRLLVPSDSYEEAKLLLSGAEGSEGAGSEDDDAPADEDKDKDEDPSVQAGAEGGAKEPRPFPISIVLIMLAALLLYALLSGHY